MTTTRHTAAATMVADTPYLVQGACVFYDDFSAGVSGWSPQYVTVTAVPVGGRTELKMVTTGLNPGPNRSGLSRSITTVIGQSYRLVVHLSATTPHELGVGASPSSGAGLSRINGASYGYPIELFYSFTASATTTFLSVHLAIAALPAGITGQVADVAVYELSTASVIDFEPIRATVTMDESWSPYVQGSIVCPLPSPDVLAAFDARRSPRMTVTLGSVDTEALLLSQVPAATGNPTTLAGLTTLLAGKTLAYLSTLLGSEYNPAVEPVRNVSRTFQVTMRSVDIDYLDSTMTVRFTSDEMRLQDWVRWEDVFPEMQPPVSNSLVVLVGWALNLIGASLVESEDVTINPFYVWPVGQSVWSFLDTFVRSSDRRLWCDESRGWHLTKPKSGASGSLVMDSPTRLTDTRSRDDGYGDSAVVEYQLLQPDGTVLRQFLFAAPTDRVAPKTEYVRFTGDNPGGLFAAAQLRTRALTRGRQLEATGVALYGATPGQALTIASVTAAPVGAMVSAVTFEQPADTMTIRTRDAT